MNNIVFQQNLVKNMNPLTFVKDSQTTVTMDKHGSITIPGNIGYVEIDRHTSTYKDGDDNPSFTILNNIETTNTPNKNQRLLIQNSTGKTIYFHGAGNTVDITHHESIIPNESTHRIITGGDHCHVKDGMMAELIFNGTNYALLSTTKTEITVLVFFDWFSF